MCRRRKSLTSGSQKSSDEVLVWLSVWSEVQIVRIWSSWCHCHSKPPSCPASFKSQLALPFWYRLTQVVPEKRPLNGHSSYMCMLRLCRRPEALRMTSSSDTVLGLVPCHHVFGLLVNLTTSLLQGCTVVNVPSLDKTHLLTAMDQYHVRITSWALQSHAHRLSFRGLSHPKPLS